MLEDTGGSADGRANIDALDVVGEGTGDSGDDLREVSSVPGLRVAAVWIANERDAGAKKVRDASSCRVHGSALYSLCSHVVLSVLRLLRKSTPAHSSATRERSMARA